MPYKIVKTYENGESKLTIVPSKWEENGVLRWPKYNINKLRREENSCHEDNWKKINCKVKRFNLNTFIDAEQELDKMCNNSETETDTEQYFQTNMLNQKDRTFEEIVHDCTAENDVLYQALEARNLEYSLTEIHPPVIDTHFNDAQQYVTQSDQARNFENALTAVHPPVNNTHFNNAQQNVTQSDETRNLENTLRVIQTPASNTDGKPQLNMTTEVQIDNASLTLMTLAKIDTLQENYKSLHEKITENIKAQQDDRKFMSESVRSIMLSLSNISVQFEYVINKFSRVENNTQKSSIQPIASENDLNNFEKELENQEIESEWKKNFSIVCGKGKGRGVNNAYALVDSMFSRCFLLQCSWAGGSRTSAQKICFKSHTKIINFFFEIIYDSDSSYTLLDCHKFFKNILKNSRQRNESKQERTSRTKNRPNIKAKRTKCCNGKQPSLPNSETCAVAGTSGSNLENHLQVVAIVEKPGPENDDRRPASASFAVIPNTEPFETFV